MATNPSHILQTNLDIEKHEQDRLSRIILISCCLTFSLIFLPWIVILFMSGNLAVINPATVDDSFYYLKPAKYFVETGVFTFDGINATNGFHPVWMTVCVFFWKILPDGISMFAAWRVYYGMVLLLYTATFLLCLHLGYKRLHPVSALAGVLLLAHFRHTNLILYGLDSTLNIPLSLVLAIVIMHFMKHPRYSKSPGFSFATGILLGVWSLTRLESLLSLPLIATFLLVMGRKMGDSWQTTFKRIAIMTIGASVVVLSYFVWNVSTFGHLMPVSGKIKTTFPHLRLHWVVFRSYPDHAFFLILNTITLIWGFRKFKRDDFPKGLFLGFVCIYLGAFVNWSYTFLFVRANTIGWYYSTQTAATLLGGALLAYWLKDWLIRRENRWLAIAMPIVALLAGAQYDLYLYLRMPQVQDSVSERDYRTALWMRDNLPEDAIVAATDCGLIGYFSERRVMNIDGVSCSYEFVPYRLEGRRGEFIRMKGANYVLSTLATRGKLSLLDDDYTFEFPEGIFNTDEVEVYRGEPFYHRGLETSMIIWKLPNRGASSE